MPFAPIALVTALLAITVIPSGGGQSSIQEGHTPPPGSHPCLVFSTYLGGSVPFDPGSKALTFAQNAASDAQGNIYVTGATQVSDLPVPKAWQPTPWAGSTMSAFVAKFDPAGALLWCTYLGGNRQSMGVGVAAMPDGGVAVAGVTSSDSQGPFPAMNSFQAHNNGQSDYFVTVFDAGGAMRYSTYLGGSGLEGGPGDVFVDDHNCGNNIAADAHGLVYVTGVTPSGGGSGAIKFPVTSNAIQPDLHGLTDAFLAVIDPRKRGASSLVYSSFLGGDRGEQGHGVAVNAGGSRITVSGYTRSSDFPITPNAYRSHAPPKDYLSNGYVTQFTSSLPGDASSHYAMHYSTYLGADSIEARDDTYGVALDPLGLIIATGRTRSAGFPMTEPPLPTIFNSAPYLGADTSGDEPYLVKIDPSLAGPASLAYSTFLGGGSPKGEWASFGSSAVVDSTGAAYVGGETWAPGVEYSPPGHPVEAPSRFPYTGDALYPALQGDQDAMLMQIDPSGAMLGYSTFLGGTKDDRAYGLAADPEDDIILTGLTFSSDFPLENPAQAWPGNAGSQNAFVTKVAMHPEPTPTPPIDLTAQKVEFQTSDRIEVFVDVWPIATPSYPFLRIVAPDGSTLYYESGKGVRSSPMPYLGFKAGAITIASPVLGYRALDEAFCGIAGGSYILEGGAVDATKTTSPDNLIYYGTVDRETLTVR